MPTYQYACTACGHELEVVQKFSDEPLTVCPECDGRLRKLFSPVGIVFKGSGFYKTDSRSGAKSGSNGSSSSSESAKSGSKDSGGTKSGGESGSGSSSSSSDSSSSSTSSTSSSTSGGSKVA
ncbi:MAG TPA: FmdB family zinc ribbon protein [Mycobacteriales bacterium]|nr:FmdB family zinc ribbon protein [Mycobacteriales bacterium]